MYLCLPPQEARKNLSKKPSPGGDRVKRSEKPVADGSSSTSTSTTNNNHNHNNMDGPVPLRTRVLAWFASLDAGERSRLLTFEDRAWCLLAANMAARLDRRAFPGQEVRFEVQVPVYGGPRCVVGGGGGVGHGGWCL